MIVQAVIIALVVLAPVTYVALRRLSVVEQEITFEHAQRGIAGITLVIREDNVQRLRITFDDGQVCEVFPATHGANGATHGTPDHSVRNGGRTMGSAVPAAQQA
jgi:hypothetical protein